ncbi:DUF2905 domain-containing protein [Hydrogenobacter thermophilus]|uniref:DUF2905 domain-containing protein n=1 Tax=Hydrogenobacter thermophilus (strain DSM 6534 / IAM 12695 / TK-6) TaxID=608538 RepID=D3DJT2_HYDTT|nr:DUF2905 domain-containing protein [Hydrogenobacter thermophilus]BAI70084.1 hypothetical protein HTH_1637 [Hydrogenobacter thermophilus TK-6]
MEQMGKYIALTGVVLLVVGLLMMFAQKLPLGLGRLPGDIVIKKDNFTFYFPLATSILLSIILTLILNLLFRK